MGRPSKLNEKTQAVICQYLRLGLHRKVAAALVKVDEVTFSRWYTTGARDEKGKFRAFFDAVNEAEALFQQDALETLKGFAAQNPKILQWWLSRRFPAQYGRHDNAQETSTTSTLESSAALKELLLGRLERLATLQTEKPAAAPATEAAPDAD